MEAILTAILQDLRTLTNVSETDYAVLRTHAAQTKTWADGLTDEFYTTLYGYAPTAHVFTADERPMREATFQHWYLQLTTGNVDDAFWEQQWFVGLLHIRRGVENQFVLGILSRIQTYFHQKCVAELPPSDAHALSTAFEKVTTVIAGLIVEGYRLHYLQAIEQVSGLNKALIDRMVSTQVDDMIATVRQPT